LSDDEEGCEKWHDQAKDTSTDFAAMGLSFLIVFFIRFLVLPQSPWFTMDRTEWEVPPSIDGELGISNQRGWVLISIGIIFCMVSGCIALAHSKFPHVAMDYLSSTVSTSAAFLLIFGLMWKCGKVGHSELTGQTCVAVILSIIAVVFVVIVSGFKYMNFHVKALKAVVLGLSLAVGLAWEKVFDAAMDAVSDYMSDASGINSERRELWIQIFFSYAYLAVVFPAWMMYILPKTDEDIQKAMKKTLSEGPLPTRSCICDADLYDDYVEEEDDDIE
jgi:hypothetical protein